MHTAAASTAAYRSFAEATGAVLDLLGRQLADCTVYLAHLDRSHDIHRIVDARQGNAFGLRSNLTMSLADSFDAAMAEDRAPGLCGDVHAHTVYSRLPVQRRWAAASYVGVPIELSDGTRVGALSAVSRQTERFRPLDHELFALLGRMLAAELERETSDRDTRRLSDSLRSQGRALETLASVASALAVDGDPRPAVCRAACEVSGASAAFLLEPSGREFVSSAMHGVEMGPVTIQPRSDTPGRAFQATESYFVADATDHPALAAPLVEATSARSALFEPILRDRAVAGVLILIWRRPMEELSEPVSEAVRLVAAQGAIAMQQAGLRNRVDRLALTDPLTGLPTKRLFDEELPRELARARRGDVPVSIALLDIDHMTAFNMLRGEGEGDRLLKEAAALWDRQLREVDVLARLDSAQFAVILPNCGISEAIEVLDRVRGVTPRSQTASAGVARWDASEPAELLILRAADALAAAKAEGGNSTVAAD
jgi:diguanylate cyclase (GGDEF)-like protein